jgi:hypothetical protein
MSKEATAISAIADLLYDFLPGSENSLLPFRLPQMRSGLESSGSKAANFPSLVQLLTGTLEQRRNRFCRSTLIFAKWLAAGESGAVSFSRMSPRTLRSGAQEHAR